MRRFNLAIFALATATLILSGCSKEEPEPETEIENGDITTLESISDETRNSIPLDEGEIGIEVDTRNLAILGYKPTSVDVMIGESLSSHSKEGLIVDLYTHVATYKLAVKDLEEDEVDAFAEGIPIQVIVYDSAGMELETKSVSRFILNESNKSLKIETEKARVLKPLAFNPSLPYYVQLVSESSVSVLGGSTDYSEGNPLEYNESGPVQLNAFNFDDELESQIQKFYFESQGDNTYAIKTAFEDSYLEVNEYGALFWNKANKSDDIDFLGIEDKHKFILDQTEDGMVKIRPYTQDSYFKVNSNSQSNYYGEITTDFDVSSQPDAESYDLRFTILSASVEWQFEDLGTKYSAPIIPPTQMDFAFKQTIINCSSVKGDYEVGTDAEESTTTTISFEEGVSMASSTTDSESASVEAEASGQIFGIGVSVKGSGTLSTSTTTGFGTSSSKEQGYEKTVTQAVSTRRTIEVLPFTAVEVFDVIQKIENVSITFAQRFLLRGVDGNMSLSGAEIATQMVANRFGGVVTEIGSDYIVFSIRGAINVDNYFEYNNTLNDIHGGCN